MLQIKLICVGKLRERFYIDAFEEYRKRLAAYCRLACADVAEQRLPDSPSDAQIRAALEKEAAEILKAIPADAYVVALCVEGRQVPSEAMAELIAGRENSEALLRDRRLLRPGREREKPGRPASEHVKNDLSAPSGARDACRAALPRL